MARTEVADDGSPLVEDPLPVAALALGGLCLLAMVPVTFGALAGAVELDYAVPALFVAMALALVGTVLTRR